MNKRVIYHVSVDDQTDGYIDLSYTAPVPQWLATNVGQRGKSWEYQDDGTGTGGDFLFFNETDATLFMIAWNGQTR